MDPLQDAAAGRASDALIYVRDLAEYDDRHILARDARNGASARVATGVYLDSGAWAELDARERYRLKVTAVARTRLRRTVLSHWSAAVLLNLPMIGPWPDEVHITVSPAPGGRSYPGVRMHALPLTDEEVIEVDGMLVTSPARTALDMAAAASEVVAVTILDRVLHIGRFARVKPLATREEIERLFAQRMPFVGHARARRSVDFSVDCSDSPLESVSRVNMRIIGVPKPQLQVRFIDHLGELFTDFGWEDFDLTGEADGKAKYSDPEYLRGRSPEDVLMAEKLRSDRLRALGRRETRWGWNVGVSPRLLKEHLNSAGLPTGVRWM